MMGTRTTATRVNAGGMELCIWKACYNAENGEFCNTVGYTDRCYNPGACPCDL